MKFTERIFVLFLLLRGSNCKKILQTKCDIFTDGMSAVVQQKDVYTKSNRKPNFATCSYANLKLENSGKNKFKIELGPECAKGQYELVLIKAKVNTDPKTIRKSGKCGYIFELQGGNINEEGGNDPRSSIRTLVNDGCQLKDAISAGKPELLPLTYKFRFWISGCPWFKVVARKPPKPSPPQLKPCVKYQKSLEGAKMDYRNNLAKCSDGEVILDKSKKLVKIRLGKDCSDPQYEFVYKKTLYKGKAKGGKVCWYAFDLQIDGFSELARLFDRCELSEAMKTWKPEHFDGTTYHFRLPNKSCPTTEITV